MRAFLDRLRVNLEKRAAELGGATPLADLIPADTPKSLYQRQHDANALRAANDVKKAHTLYTEILVEDGQFAPAWLGLGLCLLDLDRGEEARTAFTAARGLRPDDVNAHYLLGVAEMQLGNAEAAMQNWGNAVLVQRDFLPALDGLIPLLVRVSPNQAEAICRDAIALAPRVAEFHLLLGLTLTELGRLQEAIVSFRACLEQNPSIIEARLNLARIYIELAEGAKAEEEARILLAAAPELAEGHAALERALALPR
jgi:tetratricopeptide (TPR) repeat protein